MYGDTLMKKIPAKTKTTFKHLQCKIV